MRLLVPIVCVITLTFSSCAIFRPTGRPSDPLAALRYDIDQVLADSIFTPARAGIKVISSDSKEVLYERDSKLLMRPASNMKLLTSSTALHVLGKDYRFRTSVYADTAMIDGTIDGNIYIKGYGNPDLVTADLDTLVAQVRLLGVKRITGGVLADVTFFDDLYWGYGWNWDDEPSSYAAFITPLSVNDNCVTVTVSPGRLRGDSVEVTIDPPTSYVSIVNNGKTVSDSVIHRLTVTRLFKERSNAILIEGEMLPGARPIERQLSVWKPELYTATLFTEALQRNGISVAKTPLLGQVPLRGHEIAVHLQRIDSTIINMNKVSDNLTAEMLLKTLDAVSNNVPGSSEGGTFVVNKFLSTMGIDTMKYRITDGSGLSYHNLITAEMIVQLLEGMQHQTDVFPLFYQSLPIAGVDGTIRNRMKKTPAEGNLRAKTGTISGVSSLSGYVQTLDGERLIFSMSMQNYIYPARYYQRAQDKIGAILAGFSRSGLRPQPAQ
jgi:D-alanyl-D-alanine carboxypeptidase/D-alanyl-D-alanine-endopeptidase (penicillin-binding protein 4)